MTRDAPRSWPQDAASPDAAAHRDHLPIVGIRRSSQPVQTLKSLAVLLDPSGGLS